MPEKEVPLSRERHVWATPRRGDAASVSHALQKSTGAMCIFMGNYGAIAPSFKALRPRTRLAPVLRMTQ
jgi:hypothetical protein